MSGLKDGNIDLIFVGAEAEGYWSGAYECEGVFVSREMYRDNRFEFEEAFLGRTFYELDGKHSEVEGEIVIKEITSIQEITQLLSVDDVDYDPYHLLDYLDGEISKRIEGEVIALYETIENFIEGYAAVTYAVTDEEAEAIVNLLENLRKGNDNSRVLDEIEYNVGHSLGDLNHVRLREEDYYKLMEIARGAL